MIRQGVLREHSSLLLFCMRAMDLLAILVAGTLAYRVYRNSWYVDNDYQLAMAIGVLSALVFFNHFSLYRAWRGLSIAVEIRAVSAAWGSVSVTLIAIYAITDSFAQYAIQWTLLWMLSGWVLLVALRASLRLVLRWIRAEGYNQRNVVLVGMSDRGMQIARRLRNSAWTGLHVRGYFDDRPQSRIEGDGDLPHLGKLEDLASYVQREKIDQVWIVYPLKAEDRVKHAIHELRFSTTDIRFALDIFAFNLLNHSINEVAGIPILNLSASPMRGVNSFIKALEDRVLALVILLLMSPFIIAIAIGVKTSSPGPIFFRQERVSWNGKRFTMLKFRSMPVTVEEKTGPVWAKQGENRATAFGRFLRKTSLDELPQLINVLRGDMSIVGPRPERPVFVEKFKEEIPDYMKKHMVKAGITGWAQVNGWRGDTDLSKRIEHDLYYIENWSLWFDLQIVFLTVLRGFVNKNAY